jgi:NifU-like protein involved in Fe-S cluster formation
MRIFLSISSGRIERAGFETYGCVASIAAGSVLTCHLPGKSIAEAREFTASHLMELLGGLPLGKESCAATAITALRDALKVEASH